MTDLIVVGGGVMGSAAAYHGALAGADVVVIAPSEPDQRESHDGVFGAHYDQSRLYWQVDADPVAATLAHRSFPLLRAIEAQTNVRVLEQSGVLFATGLGQRGSQRRTAEARPRVEPLTGAAMTRRWPGLRFPDTVVGHHEPGPAGTLDPRAMVAAHLDGPPSGSHLDVIDDCATEISVAPGGVTVRTENGRRFEAAGVLLAAGAFTNAPGLLERPLALRVKTETVVFAHLSDAQAGEFEHLPPMIYDSLGDDGRLGDVAEIYMAPVLRNRDGGWRLKLGANTIRDRWLDDTDEIKDWYRRLPMPSALPLLRRALLQVVPDLDVTEWRSERCAITYTPHGRPMIGAIEPGRVFVATGGNGHAAKAGPELGRLAAGLALTGSWVDTELDPDAFEVRRRDDSEPWTGAELLSVRQLAR